MTARRRALIVGVDDYPSAPLAGCVNDAETMEQLLRCHEDGSPNFAVRLLTSSNARIDRSCLRESIRELLRQPDADVALLYFAGHGVVTDFGGYLVTVDAAQYDEGVNLSEVLTMANDSSAREVVIILDACMSGALGQLPGSGSPHAQLREGVAVLTASRADQVAMESGGRGVFTELVCGALEGGGADVLGQITVASVYAYVEEALGPWDQRPLFKANVAKLETLRTVAPSVDLAVLRELPGWFSSPSAEFSLDPTFEDTVPGHDPTKAAQFKKLQRCRAAKLVEPVGEEHMYYAAINSGACRLTPLGARYWRMAQEGRL